MIIQSRNYADPILAEIVRFAFHAVWRQNRERAAVLLYDLSRLNDIRHAFFAFRNISQLGPAITGFERQVVLGNQFPQRSLSIQGLEILRKSLESPEAELRDVLDSRLKVLVRLRRARKHAPSDAGVTNFESASSSGTRGQTA